jgi:signal peptidase II
MSDEAEPAAPAAKPNAARTKWLIFIIVGLLSLIADQGTKIWARDALPMHGHGSGDNGACIVPDDIVTAHCAGTAVPVAEGFWHWRLSMNPGSAFGLFGSVSVGRVLLSIVGIAAVIAMMVMLKKSRRDQKVLHWALALVVSGAIGNLIDRIYYGVVTDFVSWDLKFMVWPTFNVADIALVIGVGLMFIDIQIEGKHEKAKKLARQKEAGLVKDLEA